MLFNSKIKPVYKLLLSDYTAFTPSKANLIVGEREETTPIDKMLRYYTQQGVLQNIRKGVYVKPQYNPLEVAVMIYPPCYISLQYVLQRSGVIFQYDDAITCVSYLSKEIEVDGNIFQYSRINPEIILNYTGIEQGKAFDIATPERAFLDMYYLYPQFYFDYPDILNKEKVLEILPIYKNKSLEKRVKKLLNC
ncbi:hypothetical protein [Prevotella nigrescens]|uniref:type IV toxin-antitoxin system AbiEi family antitoxin domain-containing protein n=1 Tax=Prevotella nigrescens TaxID=28133 RepID=UPI0028DCDC1B|nr:hypothetical protein [Prevotella nigrescens]